MATLSGMIESKQTVQWKINNFSSYNDKKVGHCIKSPLFANYSWFMTFYPKGSAKEAGSHISIFLFNNKDVEVQASYTCYILNKSGEKVKLFTVLDYMFKKKSDDFGWGRFDAISRSTLLDPAKRFLVNNSLTLFCEITKDDDYIAVDPQPQLNHGSEELSAFEKLIDDKRFSDITIKVGRKKILAHKNILCSQSPVFDAMFQHDMRESQENIVDIKGIKYNIIMELLRFIYAGKVNNIEKIAQELFIAANRYAVDGLKDKCETLILSTIDNNNVLDRLKFADSCDAIILRRKLIDYIKDNGKDILNSSKFEEFAVAHPRLGIEISRTIVNDS